MGEGAPDTRRFCERCGAEVSPDDAFCWRCGNRLQPPAEAEEAPRGGSGREAPSATDTFLDDEGPEPQGGHVEDDASLAKTVAFRRPTRLSAGRDVPATGSRQGGKDAPDAPQVLPPSAFDESVELPDDGGPSRRATLLRRRTGERLELSLPAVVGRGSRATCRVEGNDAISREHARVYLEDGRYLLRDLSSTNAASVDGRALAEGGVAELHDGSTVRLADEDFVFRVDGQRQA